MNKWLPKLFRIIEISKQSFNLTDEFFMTSNQNIVQFIMKSKTLDQESIFWGVGRNFATKCLPIGKHD